MPGLSLYTYIIHDLSVLVNSTRDTFYTVTVKKYFCFFSVFTSKFVLCASWGYWHTGVGLRQYRRTTTRREPTAVFELLTTVLRGVGVQSSESLERPIKIYVLQYTSTVLHPQ